MRKTLGVAFWVVVAAVGSAQAQGRCDRDCLVGISNQYIDALAAKDATKAGLAPNVRYS
jgi:hypothetical protein